MRPETEGWWRQAETDLRAGEWNLEGGFYYMAAWAAQQAAEKAMKALWLEIHGLTPPRTHDIQALGEDLQPPESVVADLEILVPAFDRARYPDARGVPPTDLLGATDAHEYLSAAQRILEWIATRLQSPSTQN